MFLKKIVNGEIKKTVPKLLHQEVEEFGWIKDLPISRQMVLKKAVNQEIRQLRLKYMVQLELVTRFRTVDLKSKLCKEILNHARTRVVAWEQWPLRNKLQQNLIKRKQRLQSIHENACIVKDIGRSLQIEKISREVSQRQQQRRLKKRMLQELRMVKLKMGVCREIDLIGAAARDYKAVVQDIQALGDKARAMQQIKNKDHWLLKSRRSCEPRVPKEDQHSGSANEAQNPQNKVSVKEVSKETSQWFEPFELGVIEERQVMLKSLVNEAVKSLFLTKAVNKMMRIRSKAITQKSKLLSELKMHFAKTKCLFELLDQAQAQKDYAFVLMELNQRINFAKCIRHIKKGSYHLNHVPWPIEISPIVLLKQQINLTKVNTVIQQAGLKVKLNQEIVDSHKLHSRRAFAIREMEMRLTKRCINAKFQSQEMAESAKVYYRHVVQELEQRYRHKEIVKEIKTRQKQIFWKGQTCIIIRQGGNKIRVNKEIRSIARQKYLKKQINTLIKQGGLKSRLQKEIRQMRKIALVKRQRGLKAKKNRERGESVRNFVNTMENDCRHPISRERIATQKLVESVIRVSEARKKQEKVIRSLTQEITQQRADFEALNKRVVDDKKQLYRMMEDLMRKNEMLKKTLVELGKVALRADGKQQKHCQAQQSPMVYQEKQEFASTKLSVGRKSFGYHHGPLKLRAVIPEVQRSVF